MKSTVRQALKEHRFWPLVFIFVMAGFTFYSYDVAIVHASEWAIVVPTATALYTSQLMTKYMGTSGD